MPQLDFLILLTTCIETTFFFWLLYIIIVYYILKNVNNLFTLRYYIRNQIILINWVKINKFFLNNFNKFKKIIIVKIIISYNYLNKLVLVKKPIIKKTFNYFYYKKIYKQTKYMLDLVNVLKWKKN